MRSLVPVFFMLSASFGQTSGEIPDLLMDSNVLGYLESEGIVEATTDGFAIENGTQTLALAKTSGCCWVIRFLKRNTVDVATGAAKFALDGVNVVVSSTTDGIKWTVDKTTDGVSYVVEQTLDGTRWTINSAIDGTKVVIRKTTNGMSWSVEKSIPDGITWGGKTYVDFDPVKNTIQAGIRIPAKAANKSLSIAQASTTYFTNVSKDFAVGALDVVDGATFVSMDIVTFASNSTVNIADKLLELDFGGAVNETVLTFWYAFTNVLDWGDLGWCGSVADKKFYKLTRRVLISDYWPPDDQITNLLAPLGQQCRILGLARLYKGCAIHDYCYGYPGKTKEGCDQEILQDWKKACNDTYRGGSWCETNCLFNVSIFHGILSGGDDLPFTEAQAKSNSDLNFKNEQISKYNYYKSKYRDENSNEYDFSKPMRPGYEPKPFIVPLVSKKGSPAQVPITSLLLQ